MKRILEVFGEPISRGGQESYVISALQNMDLENLHVDLFTPYYCDNQLYNEYIQSIGGIINHADLPFKVGGTRREIIPCFEHFLKENEKYDIVHIHSGSISVLAYYARVASKNYVDKVIVHSHSSGVKQNLKHLFIKAYAAPIFKMYATDFCACSLEAARWKFPKSILGNVRILKNGVDLDKFSFNSEVRNIMRKKYGLKNDDFVVGHVGRFTYEKNQSFLIDVLKRFNDSIGDAKMVLVGDGIELENVKAKTAALGLKNRVIFAGSQNNINEFMDMFDVFVFPSLYEGLGIVGIEAQASGLGVIASNGVPKTINISGNVKFCDLNSITQWCNEINKFSVDSRMNNFEKIKENGFDISDTSEELRLMYLD